MSTIDNGRPEKSPEVEQARRRLRQLMPVWHPDRAPVRAPQGYAVIDVLTRLYNALDEVRPREIKGERIKNLSSWPSSFNNDDRVTFPAFSAGGPEQTIFIPKTAEEFIKLLEDIEENRGKDPVFPQKDFPRVNIKKVGEDVDEDEAPPNELVDAIVDFTDTAESIEDLKKTFKAHTMVGADRLQAVELPKKIDDRFLFLVTRDASKATTPEALETIHNEVENFTFYTPGAKKPGGIKSYADQVLAKRIKELEQGVQPTPEPESTVTTEEEERLSKMSADREALYQFFDQIRNSNTPDELDKVAADATARNFFNRGHFGLVKAAITFKRRKIAF